MTVYLDIMRNVYGQQVIVHYSMRGNGWILHVT
jgi:hypothetical protein